MICFSFTFLLIILLQSFLFISDIRHEIIVPYDDSNTLEELLNHDSSISEVRGVINRTLLHHAAMYNNSTSCLRVLLRFAPHLLDAVDSYNNTPLILAVNFDRRDAAKMLLQGGADVRPKNKYDRTVFDYARNNEEMLKILKQHQQVSGILQFL